MARAAGKRQAKKQSAKRSAKRASATRKSGRPKAAAKKKGASKRAPKRAAAARKVAKRATKKRTVKAAVKPARKAGTPRTPRAAAPKLAKHATRVTPKLKPSGQPQAARAAARPVRTQQPPAAPPPPAFAVQRAHSTPREDLLFELQRARATVRAAIQGLTAGTAEQPTAPGKWSIKEIVLHLSERDRVRLEEFARTLHGQPHSWKGMHDPEMQPVNESHLAPLRVHTWDEAVRRMDAMREQLMRHLMDVPLFPDDVWQKGHPFADMLWGLPEHDRHHAAQIKHARIGGGAPAED